MSSTIGCLAGYFLKVLMCSARTFIMIGASHVFRITVTSEALLVEAAETLLEMRARADVKDNDGKTPRDYAMTKEMKGLLKY